MIWVLIHLQIATVLSYRTAISCYWQAMWETQVTKHAVLGFDSVRKHYYRQVLYKHSDLLPHEEQNSLLERALLELSLS